MRNLCTLRNLLQVEKIVAESEGETSQKVEGFLPSLGEEDTLAHFCAAANRPLSRWRSNTRELHKGTAMRMCVQFCVLVPAGKNTILEPRSTNLGAVRFAVHFPQNLLEMGIYKAASLRCLLFLEVS